MHTALYFSSKFEEHVTPPYHPERPARLDAVETALRSEGVWQHLAHPRFEAVDDAPLLTCHTIAHVARIGQLAQGGGGLADGGDTYVSPTSDGVARLAVGAALAAVDGVMTGVYDNAFVAVRPPGHHAESKRVIGFCLYNTVAIAARWAQRQHGAQRVAILDWDVHHGNGTQDIFYEDPSVLYCSIHQAPHFPFTGEIYEVGRGAAAGTNRNFPLLAGSDRLEFLKAWEEVGQVVRDFAPDLILVSAGFDAHEDDPLGNLRLHADDFRTMAHQVKKWAATLCKNRLVMVLEGGYELDSLGESVAAVVEELLSDDLNGDK